MEYQKITKSCWTKLIITRQNSRKESGLRSLSDNLNGTHQTGKQIKFCTLMLKSSLFDYSDAYVLVKGTITITGAGADAAARNVDARNKQVTFNNCVPFTKSSTT